MGASSIFITIGSGMIEYKELLFAREKKSNVLKSSGSFCNHKDRFNKND